MKSIKNSINSNKQLLSILDINVLKNISMQSINLNDCIFLLDDLICLL